MEGAHVSACIWLSGTMWGVSCGSHNSSICDIFNVYTVPTVSVTYS